MGGKIMKTSSQLKQEKLYSLLQDNNLQLSLADLIEFTYHQLEYDYLSTDKACEDVATSRIFPLDETVEYNIKEFIGSLQLVGAGLTKAHRNKTAN